MVTNPSDKNWYGSQFLPVHDRVWGPRIRGWWAAWWREGYRYENEPDRVFVRWHGHQRTAN